MIPSFQPEFQETDWLFDEESIQAHAVSIRELMNTDFAAFLTTASRFREVAKLKGARFAEGVFARIVADGLKLQSLYGPSIEAAIQAKSLLSRFPESEEYVLSLRTLGSGYAVSGNVELGMNCFLDGFDAAISREFFVDAVIFAFDLCHWHREIGQPEQALEYLRYVSERLIDYCDSGLENILTANYGEVYLELGRLEDAEHVLLEGLRTGDAEVEQYYLYLYGALGCVRAAQGKHDEARRLLAISQEISLKFADKRITAWLGYRLADTCLDYNCPQEAVGILYDSINLCENLGDEWLLVDLHETLSKAYVNLGDIEAAFEVLQTANKILQTARRQKLGRESALLEQLNYNWTTRELELQSEIRDALIEGKEVAERASQFKSMFLTKMSHELRTPLNGVLGVTKMLLSRNLNSEDQKLAQTIYASGEHILHLVNRVLDLSKLDVGALQLDIQPFRLMDLFNEVTDLYDPLCKEKQIRLETHLSPELNELVMGDRTRIAQVITNLLGNAIKFTQVGGITLRVERSPASDEPLRAKFTVKDTGIGVSPEDQECIFEFFGQGVKARFTGGAGLGLSIGRELVTLMGGTIGVISEVGQGSEFWFEIPLPVADSDFATSEVPTFASLPSQVSPTLRGVKILVAEDDEINWMVLESMLDGLDASSIRASNGKQAVDFFADEQFDLVILDCHMDVMDGFEAASVIREMETNSRVPILALSADILEANQERCLASGMDGFVGKPVQVQELISKIAQVAPGLVSTGQTSSGTSAPVGESVRWSSAQVQSGSRAELV